MHNIPQSIRFRITVVVLLGAAALSHILVHGEAIVLHQPLQKLPYQLESWKGQEHPLQPTTAQAAGVSDYANRIYFGPGGTFIQLYIGYYASQRIGDTIHSPKNCLPGAGWDPIRSGYATLSVSGGRHIIVNEYSIQKGLDKELVFYWYLSRGRVIASEYAGKFWMVADAISRNRTDGALVRLVTPVDGEEAQARARLVSFTQLLFPYLNELIPN